MLPKIFLILFLLSFPVTVFARTNPNDIYQENKFQFENNLAKISDPHKKELVINANQMLKDLNLSECQKFDTDINKMAAILDEEKSRQNVSKTTAAFGSLNTPLDTAEYYLTFAAEAVAYQKVQDYTPQISGSLSAGVNESINSLEANLNTTQAKVTKAKEEIQKALDYYEK